ncbi:non-homologous end-joining DNA ligase [Guyparkeria sp. 1SP6A2]|nr:non-homologous end-joining DNA ligase [Guyparkeria sp. 1SP6A2]
MTRIQGHDIELSNLDKILYPEEGITKGDVIDYYRRMATRILPQIEQRPLTLQRFPDGLDADGFYQQQASEHFPGWMPTYRLPRAESSERDDKVNHILCNDEAALVYLANQGTLTLHRWLARTPRYTRPDCLIFDLDPIGDDFRPVRSAARHVVDLMQELGMSPHAMTTGSRGLHVLAPLEPELDFDRVRAVAMSMAEYLADRHPDALTTIQRKDKRQGRLYLDVMRNAYGQTAVAPYSLRARPGAPVATPLTLEELDRSDLGPQDYHIGNIAQRLGQISDPWQDMERHAADPREIEKALQSL